MTNKDFIKLLLISVGCDKKYEIEVNRASDGSYVYDIYGEGEEEGQYISIIAYDMYDVILSFLNCIKENPDIDLLNKLNYNINHLSQKYLLDDNERNIVYEQQKKAAKETERYLEETKYITDWCKENNPCPNCKINKKDYWDDIHYNCELNHNNSCQILKEYHENRDSLYKEYRERIKEENKNEN